MEKIKFLQTEHAGYPSGTPLVEAEKSSAHHQASAMLGVQVPTGYYKLAGTEGPATLAIPRFDGLVGDKHPTDPSVVGPFVCVGRVVRAVDKLPERYIAYITVGYNYPLAEVNKCTNSDAGGTIIRVEVPKRVVINYLSEVERHLDSLRERGMVFEVEYMD